MQSDFAVERDTLSWAMSKTTAILSIALIAGCASAPLVPTFRDYEGGDAACIEATNWANPISFFMDGEAHVWLKEVDGLLTPRDDRICLSPGLHSFGIRAFNKREYSTARIDLNLEPRKTYHVRANKLGITFYFRVFDKTTEPPREILSTKADISGADPAPVLVPIIVPAK